MDTAYGSYMATKTRSKPGFDKNYGLIDYKKPPRKMAVDARRERGRRKECHGDWTPCGDKCDA